MAARSSTKKSEPTVDAGSLGALQAILKRWEDFPGSAPNGTGLTGLTSNDALGWSRMQNENTAALNQLRALQGDGPMNVRYGGVIGGSSLDNNLAEDPAWYEANSRLFHHYNPASVGLMSGGMVGLKKAAK